MNDDRKKIEEALKDFMGQPDPLDKAVAELIDKAIDDVLKELGVSTGGVADTQLQMQEREIVITERDDKVAPQLNGLYIYQLLVPMAFIAWPYLNREGKLVLKIIRFDKTDRVDEKEGGDIILPS